LPRVRASPIAQFDDGGAAVRLPDGDRGERVQQVARRSREPVEPRHHQHVAGVELVEDAAKLGALSLGSARHFAELQCRA
jgi:hypothetical protein